MAQILDLGKLRFNWAGEYNPSTEYEYNDIVKYGANLYAYVSPNVGSGTVPTNTSKWTLAIEGIRYRGSYSQNVLYYVNDIVTDPYSTFIVLTQHTAVSDDADNVHLQIIAQGQPGLPIQTGNANKLLSTNGSLPQWTGTVEVDQIYAGDGQGTAAVDAESAKGLTNTVGVFAAGANDFVQLAVTNTASGDTASTDIIAYSADGKNDYGWVDMGITSREFDAANYGITGPHDGYLFMSAPKTDFATITRKRVAGGYATLTAEFPHGYSAGRLVDISGVGSGLDGRHTITEVTTLTFKFASSVLPFTDLDLDPFGEAYAPIGAGNLVLATDGTGLENKIVFAAGGFATGRTQMEITPDVNVHIAIDTDSTSPSTGALTIEGGVGVQGNIFIAGDINVAGAVDLSGVATLPLGPDAAAFAEALTNPTLVVQGDADGYAQIAFRNTNSGSTSSTDIIAYADTGTDGAGYIDIGITSSNFSDPGFTITGAHDSYIFGVAPVGTAGNGDLVIATGANGQRNAIVFAAGGLDSNSKQMTIAPDEAVFIDIATESTSFDNGALVTIGGMGVGKSLHVGQDLHVFGQVNFEAADRVIYGPGSETFANTLTHPTLVATEDANDYAQIAFKNQSSGTNASTDFIAYANNGTDVAGYIDMGITSSTFTDPNFTITGANDGYIFMVAPEGTAGKGNLVLATDGNGSENAIVFAAGGLASNNTQMKIVPNQKVQIAINTPSTSPTTGALVVQGGVGITGDVNIAGNISFGGSGTQVGTANLSVSDPMIFVGKDSTTNTNDLSFVGEYKKYVPDGTTKTITNKALTSNVATLTTSAAHGYQVGTSVTVSGVGAPFDGAATITAVTPTTFSFAKVASDVPSASTTGTVAAVYIATSTWTALTKNDITGAWNLVSNITSKPTTQIDLAQAGLVFDDLKVGGLNTTANAAVAGTLAVTGATTLTGGVASSFTTTGTVTATTGFSTTSGNIATTSGNITTASGSVSAPTVTITGNPTANTDATTVAWVRTAIGGGWTEKTSSYAVSAGESIWGNTSAGTPFTITLPANPTVNYDRVRIADIASTWANTPVTLARNGKLIQGLAEDLILNVKNASIELIYSGATYGWRLV